MKRVLPLIMLAWFVVNYSGQTVAGPFTLLSDCTDMARYMAAHYVGIATVCQNK